VFKAQYRGEVIAVKKLDIGKNAEIHEEFVKVRAQT